MKEHPILFSGEMVRAILDDRKTQTRRVMKPQPPERWGGISEITSMVKACPYGQPGQYLWVREKWWPTMHYSPCPVLYATEAERPPMGFSWRPSIHMPRWASRITLEIVSVRAERVQDISEADAKVEGITCYYSNLGSKRSNPTAIYPAFPDRDGGFLTARAAFECLWDSINAKRGYGWSSNPWCWVLEFRKVQA